MTLKETIIHCNSSQSIISDMTQQLVRANENEGPIPSQNIDIRISDEEKKGRLKRFMQVQVGWIQISMKKER